MRLLVLVSLPLLAGGAVLRAVAPPPESASPALAAGALVLLVFACCAVIVVGEAVRRVDPRVTLARHPVALTVVALGGIVAASLFATTDYPPAVWLQVGWLTAVATELLLLATMLVRALIGMWRGSDLSLWPGTHGACLALVTATLLFVPVPAYDSRPAPIVPAGERIVAQQPFYSYYDITQWGVWPW